MPLDESLYRMFQIIFPSLFFDFRDFKSILIKCGFFAMGSQYLRNLWVETNYSELYSHLFSGG